MARISCCTSCGAGRRQHVDSQVAPDTVDSARPRRTQERSRIADLHRLPPRCLSQPLAIRQLPTLIPGLHDGHPAQRTAVCTNRPRTEHLCGALGSLCCG